MYHLTKQILCFEDGTRLFLVCVKVLFLPWQEHRPYEGGFAYNCLLARFKVGTNQSGIEVEIINFELSASPSSPKLGSLFLNASSSKKELYSNRFNFSPQ